MSIALDSPPSTSLDRGDVKIEVLETVSALNATEPEWRNFLTEGVQGSTFFNDPSLVISQVELEPHIQPWVLVVRNHGKICCVAPLYLHKTDLKVEFSVVTLATIPVRMLKVFGGQFVIAADVDTAECFQIVFEYLESRKSEFGLICLENLPVSTPLWDYCHSAAIRDEQFRTFLASSQIDVDHQIRFPASHEQFLSTLSYDTRRRFRRMTRRLQEKGQLRLERVVEPGEVPHFLEGLDHIYRDTWQAKVVGYTPRSTDAQIRYFSQISRAGYLRAYLLSIDNQPIAFALGYQYNETYYFLETGYLRDWSDSSPGVVLIHLFIEDLFRYKSPALLDFIMGDQDYKRSLSNSQHRTAFIYIVPRNAFRSILYVQGLLHKCSRVLVRALSLLNVDRWMRKRLQESIRRN